MLSIKFRDIGNTEFIPHHKKCIAPLVAAGAIGAAGSLLGGLLGGSATKKAAQAQLQAQREANQTNLQLAREQNQWNLEQWNRQNEYNTPSAQMQRYLDAGINPYFALGNVQSGQADSLQSTDLANQQPVVSNLQGVGENQIAHSAIDATTQFFNGAMQWEQLKHQQLENILDTKTLMEKVKGLSYDNDMKRMQNYVYNGSMQSLMNITKNQERMSYSDVALKSLEQVGSQYDVAMKSFQSRFLQPQAYRIGEQSLNKMIADIAYTKAQEKYTKEQTNRLSEFYAIQWLNANSNWLNANSNRLNAKTNQYGTYNDAWNKTQSTYRDNYVFNKTKDALVKQIKLGVDMLDSNNQVQGWKNRLILTPFGKAMYGLGTAMSSLSPFKFK